MSIQTVRDWFRAIDEGNRAKIRAKLREFKGSKDENGETGLMRAVRNQDLDTALLLVEHEHSMTNYDGYTAIMLAALMDSTEACKLLMSFELDSILPDGRTPLMLAAERGNLHAIKALLPHNRFIYDENGKTALCYAAENGHFEAVRMLVECNGDKLCSDAKIALVAAAMNKHSKIIDYLAEHQNRHGVGAEPSHVYTARAGDSDVNIIQNPNETKKSIINDLEDLKSLVKLYKDESKAKDKAIENYESLCRRI